MEKVAKGGELVTWKGWAGLPEWQWQGWPVRIVKLFGEIVQSCEGGEETNGWEMWSGRQGRQW